MANGIFGLRIFRLACLTALAVVALAVPAAFGQGAPLVVGAVISQTGAHADLADGYRKALLLWQDEVNAAGGLLGRPIELKILDDRSDSTRVAALYAELTRGGKADALIGPYGTAATLAGAVEAEAAKRVMVAGAAWSRAVYKRTPRYVFQSCAPYVSYGAGVLAVARERGYRRLAVLARDEVAAREMAVGTVEAAQALGLAAGEVVVYPGSTADFAPFLEEVRAAQPEAWIVFGELRDTAEIVKAMKKAGYAPKLFFARSASERKLMDLLGQDAERTLGAAEYDPRLPTPGNSRFAKAYAEKWKMPPSASAAEGYAAGTVLAEAFRRAGSADPQRLRDALSSLAVPTVLGEFKVNAAGEQVGIAPALTQILDGRVQFVWPQPLQTAKLILPYPQWDEREYK
jgi:branched-chain amino acid transport system substrate-binding protein